MEIHLDLMGGMAGDMFVAAMVDALPWCQVPVVRAIDAMAHVAKVSTGFLDHRDAVLTGKRFRVARLADVAWRKSGLSSRPPEHAHVNWRVIRGAIDASTLDAATRRHAIGIFSLLAEAEAAVHGSTTDEVSFHEVGAWDSVADVVGAAALLAVVNATRWTASPAPLGSGRVRSAHGLLPVPAPATTRLLLGMQTLDDGIAGERVTPTGAAILRYLCPPSTHGTVKTAGSRTLVATGNGFGTRELAGISNHLRVLCFDPLPTALVEHRRMHIMEFDVDDQASEELAMGLDRLRANPAVLDVSQTPVFGKKNRLGTHVRVLVRADALDTVIDACFRETTTIGVRHHPAEGVALKRHMRCVEVDGLPLRVKIVERPGGRTAKAESDDVLAQRGHGARVSLRRRAEALALADGPADPDA